MTPGQERYYAERVFPRVPCRWPGCDGSMPSTYQFCTQCSNQRFTAKWLGTVDGRPITEQELALLDYRSKRKAEQAARWNKSEGSVAARARYRAAHAEKLAEYNKQWVKRNPELAREYVRRTRAKYAELREKHRRRTDAIRRSNHEHRARLWEDALNAASDELLALIDEQRRDGYRMTSGALSLDAVTPSGQTLHNSVIGEHRHLTEWADPTFDAAVSVEVRERESD